MISPAQKHSAQNFSSPLFNPERFTNIERTQEILFLNVTPGVFTNPLKRS
jgi:hypothetical protein